MLLSLASLRAPALFPQIFPPAFQSVKNRPFTFPFLILTLANSSRAVIVERAKESRKKGSDLSNKRPRALIFTTENAVVDQLGEPARNIRSALSRPFLTEDEYRAVLNLWVERGFMPWLYAKDTDRHGWRSAFRGRTSQCTNKARGIFRGPRLSELERDAADQVWSETGGNPLRILSRIGVPLINVLAAIEFWDANSFYRADLEKVRRSKSFRRDFAKKLKTIANDIEKFRFFLHRYLSSPELQDRVPYECPRPDEYPKAEWLKAISYLISHSEIVGILSGESIKGAPTKAELSGAANDLFRISMHELSNGRDGGRNHDNNELGKAYEKLVVPSITLILLSAFPQWLERSRDPVRTVKRLLKPEYLRK